MKRCDFFQQYLMGLAPDSSVDLTDKHFIDHLRMCEDCRHEHEQWKELLVDVAAPFNISNKQKKSAVDRIIMNLPFDTRPTSQKGEPLMHHVCHDIAVTMRCQDRVGLLAELTAFATAQALDIVACDCCVWAQEVTIFMQLHGAGDALRRAVALIPKFGRDISATISDVEEDDSQLNTEWKAGRSQSFLIVSNRMAPAKPKEHFVHPWHVTISSPDCRGLLAGTATLFAEHGFNVIRYSGSSVVPQYSGGNFAFAQDVRAQPPATFNRSQFMAALEEFASDFGVFGLDTHPA